MLANFVRSVFKWVLAAALCVVLWFVWGKPALDELGIDLPAIVWENGPGAGTGAGGDGHGGLSQQRAAAALRQLETLPVKGRAPKTGYSRDMFYNGWTDTDSNGCNTRDDVLARDMHVAAKDGCKLVQARITDPYTGDVFTDPASLDIDHVVALGDAWQKGAGQWSPAKRAEFAQDPGNLLAVSASANRSKGDGDAATWLPANKTFRCVYVATQVDVKARYGLWVTQAEADAIADVLQGCIQP